MYPSLYAHILNGILLITAFVLLFANYSQIKKHISRDPYKTVLLVLLFSIGVGIHGISHLGLERIYNYNPLSILTN